MEFSFVLQEVMSFLQGEYLFVCVNKRWQQEYLRQFGAKLTLAGTVDSDARRHWVAQHIPSFMSLHAVSPFQAITVLPLLKGKLAAANWLRLCRSYLLRFTQDKEKREYLCRELMGQDETFVNCLSYCIACGSVDSVEFFESQVSSLNPRQRVNIFAQVYCRGSQEILFIIVSRLIPLNHAIHLARYFNDEAFTNLLQQEQKVDRLFITAVVIVHLLLLFFLSK